MSNDTEETNIDHDIWGEIPASVVSLRTTNPIRSIIDQIISTSNHQKELINLSIGTNYLNSNIDKNCNF
jgi:hypothetical protein